ncbi:MAG: cyclic-di-AMP phosphodiesterase PgpH, partial [Epulopiscium sp.]|nr:cyclic-di-AMP phosphodiesterase PgpH [Candidatus Epulonipiscium sp.]
MNRGRALRIILVILSFALTCTAILTGEYFQTIEDIKVGAIAPKRFTSPREIENKLATEKKREEVRKQIEPLYKQEPQIEKQAEDKIELLFNKVKETQEYLAEQKEGVHQTDVDLTTDESDEKEDQSVLEEIDEQNEIFKKEQIDNLQKQSPIPLSDAQFERLIQMNSKEILELKKLCLDITQSAFSIGIREETKTKSILDVKEQFESLNLDQDIQTLGYDIVSSVIKPNMTIDEIATQKMLEEKLSKVEPVKVLPGQKIVDEGEIITEEAYQILESLGFIKADFKEESIRYFGAILLICLLHSFIYTYIWTFNKSIVDSRKEMLLLFSIYSISLLMIKFMAPFNFSWVPIPIAGMLLSILLDVRLGILLNGCITIIGALINKESLDFILFFFIVGTIFSILVMNTYKRNRILWVGILAGLLN